MKLDNNQQAFFALVKAGLWEREVRLTQFEKIDFQEVYRLAEEQSVLGLVTAGLDHIVDVKAPQEEVLQFVGTALQLEQTNLAMNGFVAQLIEKLSKNSIYAVLVKGQGIAQCYNRPFWRVSGDIDLFLSDSNYKKAKKFLLPLATSIEEEDSHELHQGMELESWFVELHGTLRSNCLPKMDKVIDEAQYDVFHYGNIRSWQNGSTLLFLPGVDDDIIFIFSHIIKHFFRGGIGLRQICDWCMLLWKYKDTLNQRLLESRIKKARVMSEWKAFASLAVNTLGMPEEAMPFYSSDKRWKGKANKIIKNILRTGTFGHNNDWGYLNEYGTLRRKLAIVRNGTNENLSHFFIFPLDSIRAWRCLITKGLLHCLTGKR